MDLMDPATSLLQTLQTKVDKVSGCKVTVGFNVAKLPAENKIPPEDIKFSFDEDMFEWPTKDPFKNRKRYYMVKNSELQDNKWIGLYLEVAVAKTNWKRTYQEVSNLKIVKVAIDTSQDPKRMRDSMPKM